MSGDLHDDNFIARMIAADGPEHANRGEAVSGEVVFDDAFVGVFASCSSGVATCSDFVLGRRLQDAASGLLFRVGCRFRDSLPTSADLPSW